MRRLAAFVTVFLAVCLANQPALAGKRVALVIGNSSYQNVAALTNPANDATAITEMFKKASFDGVEANKPNTFIAFAAKEGSTAADGDGKNSPFSAALLKHLTRPGLDIRKAFGFVRDDVMSATGNQQEPYTTNSLGGNDVAL